MVFNQKMIGRFGLSIVALLLSIGCSDSSKLDRVPVTGSVTLNGSPLEAATILFRPGTGRSGRGKIENGRIVSTGTYDIDDGIVPGKHKIAIQPIPDIPINQANLMAGESNDAMPQPPKRPSRSVRIPAKYASFERSGITAEITNGENELTIELTSK